MTRYTAIDPDRPPPPESPAVLTPSEYAAIRRLTIRIMREMPATLVQASLFGSRARGEGRSDSDIDVLLVFHRLPLGREPHASMAERIAESVAEASDVPVNVWSVSLVDCEIGNRTPMLVDALADSIPIWRSGTPVPAVEFTPADARRCCHALLTRVAEGSAAFAAACTHGRRDEAARRARDDVVRLCTAWLLLHGITRPRRGEAARRFSDSVISPPGSSPCIRRILEWVALSFGPDGRDETCSVRPPPGGLEAIGPAIDQLRTVVLDTERRMRRRLVPPMVGGGGTSPQVGAPLLRHPVYQSRRT